MVDKSILITQIASYIINTKCTVRDAGAEFGVGKSTVHKYMTEKLEDINPEMYQKVRQIIDFNLSVRHLRGGEATKEKYLKQHENPPENL
ncbi:MAG: sporulation transcriptional regulator SpoIIID [Clostridiales bacterium]|nr:sporulation transcriptional regulator SpoIIID [Clostridiales bacterium]